MLLLSCADKVKQVWGHGNVTAYTNRQTKLLSFFFILNTTKSIYYYTFGVTFNFELTETCDLVAIVLLLTLKHSSWCGYDFLQVTIVDTTSIIII